MLFHLGDLMRRQHYVQALAVIRLAAGLVAGTGLAAAMLVASPQPEGRWLLGMPVLLTAVNLAVVWRSSRQRIDRWLVPLALFDMALIWGLLFVTGGIASPLELLFLFPIGQVAIGASALAALLVAGLCAVAYSAFLVYPLGLSGLLSVSGAQLLHLASFNVIVSDMSFVAFAVAAGQTGQALRRQEGRLLDRSSRLRRTVGTLARLARITARETELPPILEAVLETTTLELGVERAAVVRRSSTSAALEVLAACGFGKAPEDLNDVAAALSKGSLVDEALRNRRRFTTQRRLRRSRNAATARQEDAPGAAAAPLLVGDLCLGCLYVDAGQHSYRWTDDALQLLETFADLTTVSLDNTRLYSGLLAEKSKLEATMGAVTDALLIYEPGGQVLLANQPFRTLLSLSTRGPELTIDQLCAHIAQSAGLGLSGVVQSPRELFEAGAAEIELGQPARVLQRRGKVVYDESGQILATVLTFHDVTEEQQAERLREEILATVSHELRTPLTSIKGYIQIFERRHMRAEPVASPHELRLVVEQVDRLMALVDDLLDVSYLPGRRVPLQRREIDLASLAQQRVAAASGATGRAIALDVRADLACGPWDAPKLGQVLDNLLTNAVKYSDPDSRISVELHSRSGLVELMVKDEGVGVAPEHLGHLFDAFYRVDSTTTRRTSGLGLGLYLCKRIIEQHGGHMHVQSIPGAGSVFGFSLPVVRRLETAGAPRLAAGAGVSSANG